MVFSINLNDEFLLKTYKVHNIISDDMLSSEVTTQTVMLNARP